MTGSVLAAYTFVHVALSLVGIVSGLVVLYGLLTGQPPFQGETPREVRALAREGKVVRPSKLRKGIPAPFEAAVLKMLGRRPEDRFGSAMELLAEVETIAYEHGVTA